MAWSAADVSEAGAASSLAQWWLRFDDPLLAQLVAQALQSNPTVTGAQAALRQARALCDAARAALFPILSASATAQRGSVGNADAGNSFNVGVDASWELDIFGANRSALFASAASLRASAANLGDVHVSIAAEVALDYITLRGTQALLSIANENLESQQETLQITRWRRQAGLATTLDTEQARAETEQTRAQLPVLQVTIEQLRHALAVLTGQPPTALSNVLSGIVKVPQADDAIALRIPAETLRQRPDVRYAEHQVSAAMARVAQARAARAPDFALGGSLGSSALSLGALGGSAALVKTLLAGVSMPLFDGGARRAQVRAQIAALDQVQSAYQSAVLAALQEVEDALVALRGDRERVLRLREASDAAGNASLMARQLFSSGLTDFQTVLDTQRTQLSTQEGLASAGLDVSADHVRLYKALGGGWNSDTAGSASAADTRYSVPSSAGNRRR